MQAAQPLPQAQTTPADAPRVQFPAKAMLKAERVLVGLHVLVAFAALSIGILLGPAQAFRRAPALHWDIPIFSYYYQALTLHGVLNALVFTTFFIIGFSYFVTQRSLERPLASHRLAWLSFGLMLGGVVLAGYAMFAGEANVLYTFYAPMLAHWTFYLGLMLVIAGTWGAAANLFMTYFRWRGEHPGEAVPLAVFGTLANMVMWCTATLGVTIEILTMLLPQSLGIIQTTDVPVTRVLFWFFGEPLVAFWLIPAYTSWYTMLPKQNGVALFSDRLARAAFLLMMIVSIPIGVQNLLVDPGVGGVWDILHAVLTFVAAVPGLLTAFNLAVTLQTVGRQRGGGTINRLWQQASSSPVMAAQLTGMLVFIMAGLLGVVQVSYPLHNALHNTTWVVGHFHLTLAGAIFLTYTSILYWLLPLLRGRALIHKKLALAQIYTWVIGILIFGGGMARAGIDGALRRTDLAAPGAYIAERLVPWLNLSALGGVFLLVSAILLYVVMVGTWFYSKKEVEDAAPIDTQAPSSTPLFFERWNLWIALVVIACIITWGPVLLAALDFVNGYWSLGYPMR